MLFDKQQKDNYTLVTSKVDKLNASNASELKTIFVNANNEGVSSMIFDLSDTKYCDSSGLSAILIANRLCNNSNGVFVLCGLQENVEKLIEISQLNRVMNITPTFSEAEDFLFMTQMEKDISKDD